jgi:hypothetical protein
VLVLAACAAGCARVGLGNEGYEERVRTELYFGLSRPGGGEVSEAEWAAFLAKEVTPRFPEGLTVLDARGQWQDRSGAVLKERTKVLILIHADTPDSRIALFNIVNVYKRTFGQQAVLRVRDTVGAKF